MDLIENERKLIENERKLIENETNLTEIEKKLSGRITNSFTIGTT